MYLPSLPSMALNLQASNSMMQLTLTVYIFTLGLSQLIYGPFTDRYGRRPIFLLGYFIFTLASAGCYFSHTASQLLVARFFQGLGAGCGFVVSNAMIADLFHGRKLARMIALGSFTWSLTPIVAPVIGGFVQEYMGWRINFLIILIYSTVLFIAFLFLLPESLAKEDRHSLHPVKLLSSYGAILKNVTFLGLIIGVMASYGAIIAFNVIGPFILQDALHVTPSHYGIDVFIIGLSYTLGLYINTLLLKKWPMLVVLGMGVLWTMLSGVFLIAFHFFNWFDVFSVVLGTCILQVAQGLVFPSSLSGSLFLFAHHKGAVSALFGSLVLLGCTAVSAVIAPLHILSELDLGIVYTALGALGIAGYLLVLITKPAALTQDEAPEH